MLNCKDFISELVDYLDGTLSAPKVDESEGHLRGCRRCRIVSKTTRQTVVLYRNWGQWYRVTVPPDVEARLFETIERRCSAGKSHSDDPAAC